MKKAIIILSLIAICLLGLNVYEFFNMQHTSTTYNEKIEEYKQINIKFSENEITINNLNSELEDVINNNSNNKEYKAWKSLIEKLNNLLNQ